MISSRYKFIFLHVPKTAGNAVQSFLLPFSDDQKIVHRHQDGVERFDVRGAVTPNKHAMLDAYARRLGPGLADYELILPIRDPLDRALSLYFSPHRAFGQPAGFVPRFDPASFKALLEDMPAMIDYLRVDGEIRRPQHLLRFASISDDLKSLAEHFGLPAPTLPVLNRSLDQGEARQHLKHDAFVIDEVTQRFAGDYSYFGFPLPG